MLGQQQPCLEPHVLIHVDELGPALQLSLESWDLVTFAICHVLELQHSGVCWVQGLCWQDGSIELNLMVVRTSLLQPGSWVSQSYQSTGQRTAGGWQFWHHRYFILHHRKNGEWRTVSWTCIRKTGTPIHPPARHRKTWLMQLTAKSLVCAISKREQHICTWPNLISGIVDTSNGCLSPKAAPSAFPTTHHGDAVLGSRPAAGHNVQGHSHHLHHWRSGNKSAVSEE